MDEQFVLEFQRQYLVSTQSALDRIRLIILQAPPPHKPTPHTHSAPPPPSPRSPRHPPPSPPPNPHPASRIQPPFMPYPRPHPHFRHYRPVISPPTPPPPPPTSTSTSKITIYPPTHHRNPRLSALCPPYLQPTTLATPCLVLSRQNQFPFSYSINTSCSNLINQGPFKVDESRKIRKACRGSIRIFATGRKGALSVLSITRGGTSRPTSKYGSSSGIAFASSR